MKKCKICGRKDGDTIRTKSDWTPYITVRVEYDLCQWHRASNTRRINIISNLMNKIIK
jgi:hypothetical protein